MAPPHCREAVSSNSLFLTVRPDSSRAEMGGERRAGRRGAAGLGGRASCPRWAGPAAPGPALSGAPRLLPSRLLPSQPPRAGRPFSVRGQAVFPPSPAPWRSYPLESFQGAAAFRALPESCHPGRPEQLESPAEVGPVQARVLLHEAGCLSRVGAHLGGRNTGQALRNPQRFGSLLFKCEK